jgi:lysophosphatidate acyltransferase
VTLSNAIFLDRNNRDDAIKNAKKAAADIHGKKVKRSIFIVFKQSFNNIF